MKLPPGKVILRLSLGLILIAVLIYLSNPSAILAAIQTANLRLILLSIPFYPLTMLAYTFRWRFIITMMGEHLPMSDAYQAMVAGAFISDFTPARIGDFSKPYMVKDKIDVGKGLASVIIDHWADALTAALLGIIGLLGLLHMRKLDVLIILIPLLGLLAALSLILLRKDLIMAAVRWINYDRITNMADSFYDAICCIKNEARLVEASVLITCFVWLIYATRVAILIRALGYNAPVLKLIFLLPLVNMLSALPFTVSGLGLVESGMTLLLVELGGPASIGLSVALIDRALAIGFNMLVGSRYASRLL
jgi:uncharacterized protein (TIRG00374 family)